MHQQTHIYKSKNYMMFIMILFKLHNQITYTYLEQPAY